MSDAEIIKALRAENARLKEKMERVLIAVGHFSARYNELLMSHSYREPGPYDPRRERSRD